MNMRFSRLSCLVLLVSAAASVASAAGSVWDLFDDAPKPGTMRLSPYAPKTWANRALAGAAPSVESLTADQEKLFDAFAKVRADTAARDKLWTDYVRLMEWQESEPSKADVRFELAVAGKTLILFDRYGRVWCDGRFVMDDDLLTVQAVERLYAEILSRSGFASKDPAAALQDKAAVRAGRRIRVFCGFEDARDQKYDDLIVKLVDEFNADPAPWAGATAGQAATIHALDPSLVKAQMIEESHLMPGRAEAAWDRDPMQINIPRNWCDWKVDVGLKKPTGRNTGDPETNIRAGIMFLCRKGFDASGKPAREFPDRRFAGWFVALQRYNGRFDGVADGRLYTSAYAERIAARLHNPDNFVPVVVALPKRSFFSSDY